MMPTSAPARGRLATIDQVVGWLSQEYLGQMALLRSDDLDDTNAIIATARARQIARTLFMVTGDQRWQVLANNHARKSARE